MKIIILQSSNLAKGYILEFKELNIHENIDEYKTKLLHPLLLSDFYKNLKRSKGFNDFISQNNAASWFIFSDYCLDDRNKPNNVVTYTVVALDRREDFLLIQKVLDSLQPKDLKKSKFVNPAFLDFISLLPVFNISYLLPDNRNFTKAFDYDELDFLKMRYLSLKNYYKRSLSFPINNAGNIEIVKDFRFILNKFNSKSVSLGIYRDIELANCIVSSICALISEQHKSGRKFFWASDRDAILTFEKANLSSPLIFTIINASLHSLVNTDNELAFFNHVDNKKPELDSFNRIPDIIAGTLAEMSVHSVGREKYVPILKNYLTNNKFNHIAKLYLNHDEYGLNTIALKAVRE